MPDHAVPCIGKGFDLIRQDAVLINPVVNLVQIVRLSTDGSPAVIRQFDLAVRLINDPVFQSDRVRHQSAVNQRTQASVQD